MNNPFSQRLRTLSAALAALASAAVLAQQPLPPRPPAGPAGSTEGEVKITKLSDLGHDYQQKARSVDGKTSQKSKIWGVFDVSFATAPEWIDSLTVTYTVVMQKTGQLKPGEKAISVFQVSVEDPDVEQGRDHKAGAVLKPAALKRFGKVIGFAAEISVGGKVVAADSQTEGPLRGQEKWWLNPKIMEGANVARRDGYLLDRMKTPFQLVDIDNYEVSR